MLHLLLLDDDAGLRDTVTEYLQRCGYSVYSSDSPADILARVATGEFTIAVVDLFLPGSDGLQVIEKAKALLPSLKILAISGGSKIENETCLRCAKELGADASLAKPFSLAELGNAIASLDAMSV